MFWQKNRQSLLQAHVSHQRLVECLDQASPTTEVELIATQDDDYTLLHRGVPLHALAGAHKEATRIAAEQCRPALGRAHLVLGIGLGYLMQAVYQRSPGQIIIYEPNASLLKFVLDNVDLTELLDSRRVLVATNTEDLLHLLSPLVAWEDPLDILVTPGYAQLLATEIPALMNRLFALVDERVRDYKTGRHFHWQWIQQFFRNLPSIRQTMPFNALACAFAGKPALIIGRGPSLDAALEDIRALSETMVLIAVGGALRTLCAAGITPHFAVFYDANGMREQLSGLPEAYLRSIRFLLSPFTEPCCFSAPAHSKILYFPQSGEALAQWLYTANPQLPDMPLKPLMLEGGGTVSLVAMQAALAMQCNPVVLIGQDLAFPNNQVYAGGIPLAMDEQGRLSLEKSETLYAAPEAVGTVEGQDGRPLPALKAYAGFIRHFERIAAAESHIRFFNASMGGARINGYELSSLKALQAELPVCDAAEAISGILGSLPDRSSHHSTASVRLGLSRLKQAVQQAIELHEKALDAHADASHINRLIYDLLNNNPFISHSLMFEMMAAQRHYNPNAATAEEIEANRALLHDNTRQCRDRLREQLLPLLIEAECRLLEVDNELAPCDLASS